MHLFPTVIAQAHSHYSGNLKIVDGFGFRHLSTDSIQHSGGIVREIWATTLKSYAHKHQTWLVLGVAGGSVIKLISQRYHPKNIVGIDIDPIIVDLGKKYFGLSKIDNLKLKIVDAKDYLLTTNDRYDYVLVDLFGRNSCPSFVYTPKFLKKLFLVGQRVFINHLYNTPLSIKSFQVLHKLITQIKSPPTVKCVLQNRILIT